MSRVAFGKRPASRDAPVREGPPADPETIGHTATLQLEMGGQTSSVNARSSAASLRNADSLDTTSLALLRKTTDNVNRANFPAASTSLAEPAAIPLPLTTPTEDVGLSIQASANDFDSLAELQRRRRQSTFNVWYGQPTTTRPRERAAGSVEQQSNRPYFSRRENTVRYERAESSNAAPNGVDGRPSTKSNTGQEPAPNFSGRRSNISQGESRRVTEVNNAPIGAQSQDVANYAVANGDAKGSKGPRGWKKLLRIMH